MSKKRRVTEEERVLFEATMGLGKLPEESPQKPSNDEAETVPRKRPQPQPRLTGVDGRTAEKLRKGALEPNATIDLHGLTEDAAHRALTSFVQNAAARGARLLLVITGKGLQPSAPDEPFDLELDRRTRGVLKAMTPRWLREPELIRFIADVRTAHRRHGGSGAFYVYLRKEQRPA
jgi:DNA-nicking Smr family endonuclease